MTIPIIKQVPPQAVGGKTLFASTNGKFYNAKGRELEPAFSPAMMRRNQHSAVSHGKTYPSMTYFNSRYCHHLIYETFVGPRTPGMHIDHINGNILDWSLENLEQVTPQENCKRAKILRILRRIGRNPEQIGQNELKRIFRSYTFQTPKIFD